MTFVLLPFLQPPTVRLRVKETEIKIVRIFSLLPLPEPRIRNWPVEFVSEPEQGL